MAAHNELGKWGEELDWKSGHHDLDIIARSEEALAIIEVKTRRNRLFGAPEEAIDYKKRLSLQSAINHYIKAHHIKAPVRFDVISIVGTIGSTPEIDHIKDVALI